jgi:hypothetical protein
MLSLLDTVGAEVVDWWLVFRNLPAETAQARGWWLWERLKPGFQHVEAWRLDRGVWARFDPSLEFVQAEVHTAPPWELVNPALQPTFLRFTRAIKLGKIREPFMIGPVTCVELVKAMIGVRAPFMRTPHQLYKYLRRST